MDSCLNLVCNFCFLFLMLFKPLLGGPWPSYCAATWALTLLSPIQTPLGFAPDHSCSFLSPGDGRRWQPWEAECKKHGGSPCTTPRHIRVSAAQPSSVSCKLFVPVQDFHEALSLRSYQSPSWWHIWCLPSEQSLATCHHPFLSVLQPAQLSHFAALL